MHSVRNYASHSCCALNALQKTCYTSHAARNLKSNLEKACELFILRRSLPASGLLPFLRISAGQRLCAFQPKPNELLVVWRLGTKPAKVSNPRNSADKLDSKLSSFTYPERAGPSRVELVSHVTCNQHYLKHGRSYQPNLGSILLFSLCVLDLTLDAAASPRRKVGPRALVQKSRPSVWWPADPCFRMLD